MIDYSMVVNLVVEVIKTALPIGIIFLLVCKPTSSLRLM